MGVQGTYLFAWKISFQKASRTEEYSFGVKKYEKTKKKKRRLDRCFASRKEENTDYAAVCFWVELCSTQPASAQKNRGEALTCTLVFLMKADP